MNQVRGGSIIKHMMHTHKNNNVIQRKIEKNIEEIGK
jgi:hypothetical protein